MEEYTEHHSIGELEMEVIFMYDMIRGLELAKI